MYKKFIERGTDIIKTVCMKPYLVAMWRLDYNEKRVSQGGYVKWKRMIEIKRKNVRSILELKPAITKAD